MTTSRPADVEDGHLQRCDAQRVVVAAVAAARLQGVDRDVHCVGQIGVLGVRVLECGGDRLGRPAHHHEVRLVGDRPVVGDPVQLRRFGLAIVSDLGDAQLDLVRFGLFGEDGAQRLRVHVGQLPSGHIAAIVGVAAGVGELNSAAAQIVELVEPADRGEADAVIKLTDFLSRTKHYFADLSANLCALHLRAPHAINGP